jgi:aspartate kinase
VTGIANLGKRAQVKIEGAEDFHSSGLATKVFQLLADAGVSVDLIYLSPDLIAFIIDQAKVETARRVLTPLGLSVKIELGFAKVSVVGAGMHGVPGVMARVVNCLEAEGIPIYQTTDSHANISCLVLEEHVPRAVQALYRGFQLDRI